MEGASYAGLFRGGDTFYNSVNLFSNIMQSIESYIIEENNPSLPFCMDILKTLILQINSFVDPIKTVTINIATTPITINLANTPGHSFYVMSARFCETVVLYNNFFKAMAQHLRSNHSDDVLKAACANHLHMMSVNISQTIRLLENCE